ncbi:YqcI/YcgG family protein [Streptomyces sodiiphilus]|uniref:YqcI/YcgG family protein n=1 Tax=Streptomyces sodiiphilus TaxID=226217 RepID=A0ABN2P7W1_9ACTN
MTENQLSSADRTTPDPLTTPLVRDPRRPGTVAWQTEAAERFRQRMFDENTPFPCVFGVDALRKATLRFAFLEQQPDVSVQLAAALSDFVALAPALGRRTSLVVFFAPAEDDATRDVESFHTQVWDLLQGVHDLDKKPWPADIPLDTEHPEWEFSFAGMPMFVVANTPAHRRRASRWFDSLAITFQPRFVFDDISEDSKQGRNARTIIRGRLAEYDDVPASPLLGSFGKPGNREWAQYFLDDDNAPLGRDAHCPLRVRHDESHATNSQENIR